MSGVQGQRVSLGQRDAPDVELIVSGTHTYATYETLDGFPAIYDDGLGLFCYARLEQGAFQSTGIPVTAPPPSGLDRHVRESDSVRAAKIKARERAMEERSASKGDRV